MSIIQERYFGKKAFNVEGILVTGVPDLEVKLPDVLPQFALRQLFCNRDIFCCLLIQISDLNT